jgi:heat shock protein HslJ/pimeloyl-ACP methyl ester carboxylesterase
MAALRGQGIEPLAFNTPQNAADAADLLAALGYAQADLLGVSYGTRLALEMVRSQPHAVRAVVLDSTVAPETLTYELQALGDYEARLWPFADCEATPACSGRFGAMAGRFLALLNRLDDEENALVGDGVKLDAAALYHITDATLDRPDLLALLPLIVDELDRGVVTTYQALLDGEFGAPPAPAAPIYAFEQFIPRFDAYLRTLPAAEVGAQRAALAALPVDDAENQALLDFIAANLPDPLAAELRTIAAPMTPYEHNRLLATYGAGLALYQHGDLGAVKGIIDCQEEIPFVDPDAVRKNQAVIPAPSLLPPYDFAASVRGEQRACLDQGITPTPASFKDAVTSDKPVLLLAGAQDTTTPALWGQLAAASLPNAVQVTFPAYGHALLYYAGACVAQIAAAFLDAPTHPPAATCIPTINYALDPPLQMALTGRMWRLQGWAGAEASDLPVTAFFGGGMVGGLDGCGAYSGEFTLEGDRLAVTDLAAADTGCAEEAHTLQAAFLSALAAAETIYIRGSRLLLTTAAGDLLIFIAEDDLPLEETVWMLAALRDAAEPAPALPDVAVTARFTDDRLLGGAGCNLYEATYSLAADALAVSDLRRVGNDQCDSPPGVMAQEAALLALLADVRSYRVIGRELLLYGESGAPLLVFYAAAE